MFRHSIYLLILFLLGVVQSLANLGYAQLNQFMVADADPKDVLSTVNYLLNPTVASEIRVSPELLEELKDVIDNAKGALAILVFEEGQEMPSTEEDAIRLADSVIAQRKEHMQNLFDPFQLDRLKQVSYQLEIIKKGVRTAILEGFTGADIGVKDFEKPGLETLFDSVQKEYEQSFEKVTMNAWVKYTEILGDEANGSMLKLLGRPYEIRELVYYSKNDEAIPSLTEGQKLLSLLDIPCVSRILTFDSFKSNELRSLLSKHNSAKGALVREMRNKSLPKVSIDLEISKLDKEFEASVEASFGKGFFSTLRSLALQIEMSRIGIFNSLQMGQLGIAIEFDRSLSSEKKDALEKIEQDLVSDYAQLRQKELAATLKFLAPSQSSELVKLLGKPFEFRTAKVYVVPAISK